MEENKTKKATQNIAYSMLNQILSLVLSFISRTVFINFLGVEYLGINGLFSDVLNLLSLADLGFNTAMTFSFYKPLAEKDYKKMAGLTHFYKKVYFIVTVLVAVVGIALIPFLKYIVNTETPINNLEIYYLLSLAGIIVSYVCVYKTSIIIASQNGYIITKITMITSIIKTVIQTISLVLWKNYIIYLMIGVVINLMNNIIASIVAEKQYPFIKEHHELSKDEQKNIFSNMGSIFIYKVSSVMMNATDNILTSIIVSTMMVGYYSNYLMLQNKINLFYSLIFTSMTASVGHLMIKGTTKRKYEIFNCEQIISFIICGIVIPCYVVLVNDFMNIWLGNEYVLSNAVTYCIGLNMYFGCVLQPLWSYREATGLYQKTKWVMFSCGILNIILSIILGMYMGLAGIILASVLSRLMTYIWYEPRLLFVEYFDKKPTKYYIDILKNIILIATMVAVFELVGKQIVINNFFEWIIKALIVGIISLLVMILVYKNTDGYKLFKEKFVDKLLKRVLNILKRIFNKIKAPFVNLYYLISYKNYKKNRFNIMSNEDLINEIINNKKSLSRFGDGELKWAFTKANIAFQDDNQELSKCLKDIILSKSDDNPNAIVGIHRAFNDISEYTSTSKKFWRKFNVSNEEKILSKIPTDKIYAASNITRPYIAYEDKSDSSVQARFNLIKRIWENKNVIMVEGEQTKLGVGNDLFDNCKSIKRILCPSVNAFAKYDEICNAIRKQKKDKLFLLAIGPTATVVAYNMSKEGYQCIDIGHIDIEYLWYKNKSKKVEKVSGKYVLEANSVGDDENSFDDQYKKQIIEIIK